MKKIIILCLFSSLIAQDKPKSELKNVTVLPYTKKSEIMKYMKKTVSKELGVKCSFCHNVRDYSSDENSHKIVAREMMRMVMNINETTMKPLKMHEVSCWVCHRGNEHPDHL